MSIVQLLYVLVMLPVGAGQDVVKAAAASNRAPVSKNVSTDARTEELGSLPVELRDPAFERYVDLSDLGNAITSRDAALFTDVALQLAEGERVLFRPHKSGITAKALLGKAITLAADNQDKATLKRLAKVAELLKDKELAEQVAIQDKLGGASRAPDSALTVSLAALDVGAALTIKAVLNAINEAKLTENAELMKSVDTRITEAPGLTDDQRASLAKVADTARESIVSDESSTANVLRKLAAASRDWGPFENTPVDPGTWNPGDWVRRPPQGTDAADWLDTGPTALSCNLTNKTNYNVGFNLGGQWETFSPGQSGSFSVWSPANVTISQLGGGSARINLPRSGRYAFIVQGGKIGIAFDDIAPAAAEPNFFINPNSGAVYEGQTYLGDAKRVRFKSGKTGWHFQIPKGWRIYRVDGEPQTRKAL